MKSFATATTLLGSAALAAAQFTILPNGDTKCSYANQAAYCAGGDIIVRCNNGVGQPGNCNDNLAGRPPLGDTGTAICYEASGTGNAACAKNGTVYPDSGAGPFTTNTPFSVPATATATATATSTPSSSSTSTTYAAQFTVLPDGDFQCYSNSQAAYCAGGSIIVRCNNGVGQPGNCNDNLAGRPPLGNTGTAICYAGSGTGDAACAKNGTVYPDSGAGPFTTNTPFPVPATATAGPTSTAMPSSVGVYPNGTMPSGIVVVTISANCSSYGVVGPTVISLPASKVTGSIAYGNAPAFTNSASRGSSGSMGSSGSSVSSGTPGSIAPGSPGSAAMAGTPGSPAYTAVSGNAPSTTPEAFKGSAAGFSVPEALSYGVLAALAIIGAL